MPKSPRSGVVPSPHDALFKWTFSQREHALGLLKAALPEAVVKAVRWSTLRAALEALLRYLVATHERLDVKKASRILEKAAGPQAQEVIVTVLDEIERRGERRGRAAGRAQTLLELLAIRFGAVPAKMSARILAADEATLTTWTARLLSASTMQEVLGEDRARSSSAQRTQARKRSRQV